MTTNQPPTLPKNLPTTARAAFPDPHLKACDLPAGGATYVIARHEWKYLRPQGEWELKPLLYFTTPNGRPCSKYLILNKTNAEAMTAIFETDDFEAWYGKPIHLSPARIKGKDSVVAGPAPEKHRAPRPEGDVEQTPAAKATIADF